MYSKLIQTDRWLFTLINQRWSNRTFDLLMPFIREPLTWIPLYFFLIVYAILNFPRKALSWILTLGMTAALTDAISSHLIKPLFARPRPCSDFSLLEHMRMLAIHCGSNGSFTSSHAANHFGVAMFVFMTLTQVWKKFTLFFFLWASAICYAQVYVGVHYPFDVIGGAMLGLLGGWLTGKLHVMKFGNIELQNAQS